MNVYEYRCNTCVTASRYMCNTHVLHVIHISLPRCNTHVLHVIHISLPMCNTHKALLMYHTLTVRVLWVESKSYIRVPWDSPGWEAWGITLTSALQKLWQIVGSGSVLSMINSQSQNKTWIFNIATLLSIYFLSFLCRIKLLLQIHMAANRACRFASWS